MLQLRILKVLKFFVIPVKAGIHYGLFIGVLFAMLTGPQSVAGAVELNTGGHVKLRGQASRLADTSFYELVDDGPFLDASLEARLKGAVRFTDTVSFETHYEAILSGGDTRKKNFELAALFPGVGLEAYLNTQIPEDDHRVFDFTAVVSDEDSWILYHRLDRFALTVTPEWGVVRAGRQVVTWGNGMLFNPMDLFNPFAPTDIEREYKVGDDMVSIQAPVFDSGELHLLYVPRRNPATSDIEWDQSSFAAKYHVSYNMNEFDVLAARHYEDHVLGLGSVGYLGSAAWRADVTWTLLDEESPSDNSLSLVANMDYSWVWWNKNMYGFLEYYYSGIGENHYENVLTNADILDRVQRGELYTLGKTYLAGSLTLELHPLFNVHLTAITNLKDPSGILQPTLIYDVTQNIRMLVGSSLLWGADGTEFGGVEIPFTDFTTRSPDTIFLWITTYF